MKDDSIPPWEDHFLELINYADEIAIRSYNHLILNFIITVDIPISTSIGQSEFERNEVEMIRLGLIKKWEIKRDYYIRLCEFGLMVFVSLTDGYGRTSVEPVPFSTYVKMVDKCEYEMESIKWFPSQFDNIHHFEQYKTAKLIEAGVLNSDLVAA